MKNIIRDRIRGRREAMGISQEKLGMEALDFKSGDENKAQKVISKIERGERNIDAAELFYIAKHLKKPVGYFFGDDAVSNGNVASINCTLPPMASGICDMIKEIFESSDTQIHDALHTNLVAFKNSAIKDKRIDNLEKKVDHLLELYNPKIESGT